MPIIGDKTMKTNIVSSRYCNCNKCFNYESNSNNYISNLIPFFNIGDEVYALNNIYQFKHAIIQTIDNGLFSVLFDDGTVGKGTIQTIKHYYGIGTNNGPCNISKKCKKR
jgi:hypothetical protein